MSACRFFIIGAPKCGTTSLTRWLQTHPRVFMSPVKEPHYYSADLANRKVTSRAQYEALFDGEVAGWHKAIGEASTWYLYSTDAVPRIESEHPGALYIVMTRDPVAMAHSLYYHNVRVMHEDQPNFEAAWRLQEERAASRALPASCEEPAFLQYHEVCALGSLLQRLLRQVPPERVLHVPLDAMQVDPGWEYRRVLAFLGVENDGRDEFPVANEARGYRSRAIQRILRVGGRIRLAMGIKRGSGLAKLNDRAISKAPLSRAFQAELEQAFAAERRLLAKLTAEMHPEERAE